MQTRTALRSGLGFRDKQARAQQQAAPLHTRAFFCIITAQSPSPLSLAEQQPAMSVTLHTNLGDIKVSALLSVQARETRTNINHSHSRSKSSVRLSPRLRKTFSDTAQRAPTTLSNGIVTSKVRYCSLALASLLQGSLMLMPLPFT